MRPLSSALPSQASTQPTLPCGIVKNLTRSTAYCHGQRAMCNPGESVSDRGAHARKGSISVDQAIATLVQREHG